MLRLTTPVPEGEYHNDSNSIHMEDLKVDGIIASIITGSLSIVGVIVSNIISNISTSRKTEAQIKIGQAVTDTKLEALTREVRHHNNFAEQIPRMKTEIEALKDTVEQLKKYHMQTLE